MPEIFFTICFQVSALNLCRPLIFSGGIFFSFFFPCVGTYFTGVESSTFGGEIILYDLFARIRTYFTDDFLSFSHFF